MSFELLNKMIEADDKRKEIVTPEPSKGNIEPESQDAVEPNSDDIGVKSEDESADSETKVGDKKSETPKDKSKFTEKEKMEYAFKKQFHKQESKFKSQLEQMRAELDEFKTKTKVEAPKVTRDNFASDDEFMDWKLEQKANEKFEELQKKQLEIQIAERTASEQRTNITSKVESLFEESGELELYNNMVKYAIDNGFEDALNHKNGQDIKSFVDNSSIGPRVLQHLIGFPDKFNEIFNMTDPVDKKLELKLLERELQNEIKYKKSLKTSNIDNKDLKKSQPNVPVIGKLGSIGSNNHSSNLSKAEEDAETMKFIRSR